MKKESKKSTQSENTRKNSNGPAKRSVVGTFAKKNSDDLYKVFFDRSNPDYTKAWNELHDIYFKLIQKEYPQFCSFVFDLENVLNMDLRLRAVYLLFRKIVPTIDPTDFEPLALLHLAINHVIKQEDFNLLCVFIQIASDRLKEIEEHFLSNARSIQGRIANSMSFASTDSSKRKEAELLNPLFVEIAKRKLEFADGYREIMVDKLIEDKDYLIKKIEDYKDKAYEIEAITEINKLYSRLEEIQDKDAGEKSKKIRYNIVEELLKIKRLEKYYYDQFRRWTRPEEYTLYCGLLSIHKAINYPLLQNVFWKDLDPWPIKEYLTECSECMKTLLDIPLIAILCIVILCAKKPSSIDVINDMLKSNFGYTVDSAQLASIVKLGYLEMSNPNNPTDPHQIYRLGNAGYDFLKDKKI